MINLNYLGHELKITHAYKSKRYYDFACEKCNIKGYFNVKLNKYYYFRVRLDDENLICNEWQIKNLLE